MILVTLPHPAGNAEGLGAGRERAGPGRACLSHRHRPRSGGGAKRLRRRPAHGRPLRVAAVAVLELLA
jgi:hypothetical protein